MEVGNITLTVTITQPSLRINEVAASQVSQTEDIIFSRWFRYDDTEVRGLIADKYTKPGTGIPKSDLSDGVQASLDLADRAIQSETDPTVPSWAKEAQKPSYDYSEIGNTPSIPSQLNDLSDVEIQNPISGKVLKYNGTKWAEGDADALPSQAGNRGKFLKTNGTDTSWEIVNEARERFECNFTIADEIVSCNKTFSEISAAVSSEKEIIATLRVYLTEQNYIDCNCWFSENIGDSLFSFTIYAIIGVGLVFGHIMCSHGYNSDVFQFESFINSIDIDKIHSLAAVATSGDYNDLSNKPTISTVNDATLTIQKNGTNVDTFTANASQNKTINITVPASAADINAIPTTDKGAANGVASLGSDGKVPSAQLPSYVDDVLEYASLSSFPQTGESGKIYVATDTNKTYRWSGSAYVEISESLALGETSSTAYAGNKGKANADAIAAIKDGTSIDSFGDVETALSGKQATIDSSHKLSADLVEDGSTNKAFTATEQTKLAGIASGAEVNVQSDWSQTNSSADDFIKNKPSVVLYSQQTLTLEQQAQARANIGAGTSVFSGDYKDLTNKPALKTDNTSAQSTSASETISGTINLHKVSKTGTYSDLIGTPNLAAVATSGSYSDLSGTPTIPAAQVNSDWNSSSGVSQILNKPTLGTAAAKNVPASGNASTTQVVMGDDTRLNDARTPTAHTHGNITNDGKVGSASGKILTTGTDGAIQASDSITKSMISDFPSLATVATSGSYNDLSDKPSIPSAQVQSDYQQMDNTAVDYIKNAPIVRVYRNVTGTAAVTTPAASYTGAKYDVTDNTITSYVDGMVVCVKVPVIGNGTYGTGLQINSLGYKPIVYNVNTMITNRYSVGGVIWAVYNDSQTAVFYDAGTKYTVTGCWQVMDYNIDTTAPYNLTRYNGTRLVSADLYRYVLLLRKDLTTLIPIHSVVGTSPAASTATTKTMTTESFDPFGEIYYYATNEEVTSGNTVNMSALYVQKSAVDARYIFNCNKTLTTNKELYLVMDLQSDGQVKLASTPWSQTLPTTNDGHLYKLIGYTYSNYQFELYFYHPIYYHDGTQLRQYTGASIPDAVSGTNDGTNWTTLTIGSVTKNIPSGGGLTNLDYTALAAITHSNASTTEYITFAANQRNNIWIDTSVDLDIALTCNNNAEGYILVNNTSSSDIDVTISTINNSSSNFTVMGGTITVPANKKYELGWLKYMKPVQDSADEPHYIITNVEI